MKKEKTKTYKLTAAERAALWTVVKMRLDRCAPGDDEDFILSLQSALAVLEGA